MKLSLQESGGYAGLSQHYTLDTASLADRKAWEDWVEGSGFFTAPAFIPSESIGADLLQWQITITDEHRQHSVTVTATGTPETAPWQALVERIKAVAVQR